MSSFYFSPIAQALGWTIIHSLWQIFIIAAALKVLLDLNLLKSAQSRYALAFLTIISAGVWSGFTFSSEWTIAQEQAEIFAFPQDKNLPLTQMTVEPSLETEMVETNRWESWLFQLEGFIPFLTLLWVFGVFLYTLKMGFSYYHLHKLHRSSVSTIPDHWEKKLMQLCQQMGVRKKVACLLSPNVTEPITFWHWKPVILAPVSLFTGFTAAQIEVLLLHELAHIRRHDYLFNLIQSVVEVLFFYHPAIWWISKVVRQEREHCCDDLVLQIQGQPMLYAQTLTQIQVNHFSTKTNLAMSSTGKTGPFTRRIHRLFGKGSPRSTFSASILAFLLVMSCLISVAFFQPNESDSYVQDDVVSISQDTIIPLFDGELQPSAPLSIFIINGEKIIEKTDGKELKDLLEELGLKEDDIDYINVLKKPEYIEEYGEKAKNGVCFIQTFDGVKLDNSIDSLTPQKNGYIEKRGESEPYGISVFVINDKEVEILESPINGFFIPSVITKKYGEILEVHVAFNAPEYVEKYGEKAKNGVIFARTKTADNYLEWTDEKPLQIEGDEEALHIRLYPVPLEGRFSLTEDKVELIGAEMVPITPKAADLAIEEIEPLEEGGIPIIFDNGQNGKISGEIRNKHQIGLNYKNPPLFIVDGRENTITEGRHSLGVLTPEEIESIEVLKGEAAKELYGAKGQNGVIKIRTKMPIVTEKKKTEEIPDVQFFTSKDKKEPLILVDGQELDGEGRKYVIDDINPKDIERITVLKGENAIKAYGEKAENGAILIQTKISVEKKEQIEEPGFSLKFPDEKPQPLIVVDGEIFDKEGKNHLLEEYDPKDIEKINVIKGKKATKLYGVNAKNGVVEIFTKQGVKSENIRELKKLAGPDSPEHDIIKKADFILVDGKEFKADGQKYTLENLDLSKVKRIHLLNGKTAKSLYGKKAKHGVILIETKKTSEKGAEIIYPLPEIVVVGYRTPKKELPSNIVKEGEQMTLAKVDINVFPNPSAGEANLRVQLDRTATINIGIFNMQGQQVQQLVNNQQHEAGQYNFKWYPEAGMTGRFVIRLEVNGRVYNEQIVLVK